MHFAFPRVSHEAAKRKGKFPSIFLKKRHTSNVQENSRVYTYDRDIVYLPKSFVQRGGLIQLPRKKDDRKFLVANKLIGKVRLRSNMNKGEIFQEVRSVFRSPMGYNDKFQFTILQTSEGDSKSQNCQVLTDGRQQQLQEEMLKFPYTFLLMIDKLILILCAVWNYRFVLAMEEMD